MSKASNADSREIAGKDDLIAWFASNCVSPEALRIGIEHEKPPFYLQDNAPVPYVGGRDKKPGIREFLLRLRDKFGWAADYEGGNPVGLRRGKASWTLEPAGQMETGGAPLQDVHQSARETEEVVSEAVFAGRELGIGLLALGYHPTHTGRTLPLMPKSRYRVWRRYVESHNVPREMDGTSCTAALQVNLDYTSEEDMVKMLRVALSLQPVATALFAASPFSEGQPTGFQSTRSEVIRSYMGDRFGSMLPVAFAPDFGFEKFVDYAIDLPMMGVYDKENFVGFADVEGVTFRDFMERGLPGFPGRRPTIADWENHLNTIWAEVRVRRFLEMRGADNGPAEMMKALPAFWVGLLYDKQALDAAYEMVRDWTEEDRAYLREQAPRTGLQTEFLGGTLQGLALNCLAIAEGGLRRRAVLDGAGNDESVYLAPLKEIAHSGKNWAVRLTERFYGVWDGDVSKVYEDMDYAKAPSVFSPEPAPTPPTAPAAKQRPDYQ